MTTARIISEKRICLPGIEPAEPGAVFAAMLPWPPTVNTYWRSVVIGRSVRVLLSEAARQYRRDVVRAVGRVRPLTGPLSFTAVFCPPDRRRMDLDNRPKGLLDSLAKAGVFADDSQVRDMHTAFGPVVEGGEVRVRIVPLADAPRLIPYPLVDALLVRVGVMCDLLTRAAERRECR